MTGPVRRLRILLSAFACEPGAGSENGIGWNWATTLARDHDVTVITDASFRDPIEAELRVRPQPSLRIVFVGPGADRTEGLAIWPYYFRWQRRILPVAKRLHAAQSFDVVHHATYGAHRAPSYLHRLGIPFLWGPVGGGEGVPIRFYAPSWIGRDEALREAVRYAWNAVCRVDPRLRATARGADVIAATTAQTRDAMPGDVHDRVLLLGGAMLDPDDLVRIAQRRATPPSAEGASCLWVGRVLGWKGPTYALEAFARYARGRPAATLHIYGEGPAAAALPSRAAALGVADRMVLHGRVPRDELLVAYARHQFFLFPSLHDSSGFAPLEAMAAALPVVCIDVGGTGAAVSADAGVKVPVTSPARVVRDLAAGLARLTDDTVAWQAASDGARRHALDPATARTSEQMVRVLYGRAGLLDG